MKKTRSPKIQSRIPLLRMTYIRRAILRRVPFTAAEMAEQLETHPRTIERDIEFMRNWLGYEIQFDFKLNSYVGRVPAITTL
jgi:predicted DNA-binding transcriptional regulator YafY